MTCQELLLSPQTKFLEVCLGASQYNIALEFIITTSDLIKVGWEIVLVISRKFISGIFSNLNFSTNIFKRVKSMVVR